MAQFAELVATAIANAEARTEVERLADEQAALRRVATLVAEGASPTAVFDAVAAEMERLLDADRVVLNRYEAGPRSRWSPIAGRRRGDCRPGRGSAPRAGTCRRLVRRTERPARIERLRASATAPSLSLPRSLVRGTAVGAPIVVDGRLWGVITPTGTREKSPPADTEERMAQFAAAARDRDRERRQPRPAHSLARASAHRRRRSPPPRRAGPARRRTAAARARDRDAEARPASAFARTTGRRSRSSARRSSRPSRATRSCASWRTGSFPSALSRGGLRAGVDAFVARLDLPVRVDVPAERFPAEIEASAYFIVAEALTNVVKHAHAGQRRGQSVRRGRDAPRRGSRRRDRRRRPGRSRAGGDGRPGDRARRTAHIESPAGGGTLVAAAIPIRG